ncbi:MAG: pantoate--beta-alanine ligase [Planctomycetales bacterium]|nr:pantoate--beta-alanine ligase [Planctomycetales bacterium]
MKIANTADEAYAHIDHWRREGQRIGLVPTMGALHQGHLSLATRSCQECDITAVTIFVNPTQFGPHEDFSRYPRTLEQDLKMLQELGVDLVFTPSNERLYPNGYSTYVSPPDVAKPLEGVFRPGHFRGVATIVLKLFQILPANIAYFGQKDFQQLVVIQRMAEDLNIPIRVVGCPTVRESDGLAMSSRNRYLDPKQRFAAASLWKALSAAQQMLLEGNREVKQLEEVMQQTLYREGAEKIEYARVVDSHWLTDLTTVDRPAVALIAAYVGSTRLIDNIMLETSQKQRHS